jgi:hypothetical protein
VGKIKNIYKVYSLIYLMENLVTLPTSNHFCLQGYQIPQVRQILERIFPVSPLIIVDGTCHIGADSINFFQTFKTATIYAIDSDPEAINCIQQNVDTVGGRDRFNIVNEDFLSWMERERVKADFYYLDPPWDENYHIPKEIGVYLNGVLIEQIINRIFELKLTAKVLVKVPRNFSCPAFKASIGKRTNIFYVYKGKHQQIAYGLVLVW